MKQNTGEVVLDTLYKQAVWDAEGLNTGWARLGRIWCAYYPNSKRHAWFVDGQGVTNRRDALTYLEERLK